MKYSLRQKLGALLIDAPYYLFCLIQNNWLEVKNRQDKFSYGQENIGLKCEWKWTNELYLPKVFPWFGRRLFKTMLKNSGFEFAETEVLRERAPQVSFIIGHRGKTRTPLLIETLKSIAAQTNCQVECIVVEQDCAPHLAPLMPEWVTHIVTPPATPDTPYSRAWAFNVGAKHAKADCLILHDNDLLVSTSYASEVLRRYQQGYEFINLKRFIFYLTQDATCEVLNNSKISPRLTVQAIMQNAEGGGSIGAARKEYFKIGGFDERFIGWGGEDNEFWERAQTRKVWPYAYLPLIHLWHEPQTGKQSSTSTTKQLYESLQKTHPKQRIKNLVTTQNLDD